MKTYHIQVKHDSGEQGFRIRAENIDFALRKVMDAEKCPLSAVLYWRVVPTAKQIQKTKNLMRGA